MATPLVHVFRFIGQTTTGAQVVSEAFGFTPKAFYFFTSSDGGYFPFAFAEGLDDLTTHCGRAVSSGYFIGNNSGSSTWSSSGYSLIGDRALATNQVMALGYVSACNSTSVTIQWDTMGLDPQPIEWKCLAIGGASTNVKVTAFTWVGSGSASSTAVGFQPEGLIGFLNSGTTTSGSLTTGACISALTVCAATACGGAMSFALNGGAFEAPSDTKSRQEAKFWVDTDGNSSTFTSFDANGFTVNNSVGGGGFFFGNLAINGCACNVGTFTQPTSTGNQVVPILASTPRAVIIAGTDKVSATGNTDNVLQSLGACDLNTLTQQSVWSGNLDNKAADGFANAVASTASYVIRVEQPTGHYTSTLVARASVVSSTNQQFVLNWDTVDSTEREFFYLIIADSTAQACGVSATGTITVIKNATPVPGGATEFPFSTTGGLSPSTFTLLDGESQVFSGLSSGTYGVTELAPSGWLASYSVSNSDPHDALVINANAITVTVTNTFQTSANQLRRLRRFALPYSENKMVFVPRLEIVAAMGVGNSDAPDPEIKIRLSRDGGNTFGAFRTMTVGAAAEYTKRAYITRLGRGRNLVAELICDDPVFVAWVQCVLPQGVTEGTS